MAIRLPTRMVSSLALIEATPAGFNLVSTFDLPKGEGPSWAHPVISDGKLFLRWNDKLYTYDLRR